jgi:hypothetical protein
LVVPTGAQLLGDDQRDHLIEQSLDAASAAWRGSHASCATLASCSSRWIHSSISPANAP